MSLPSKGPLNGAIAAGRSYVLHFAFSLMACVVLAGCGVSGGASGDPGINPSPNPPGPPTNPNPPGTGPVYTVGGTLAGLASGATLVLGDNFGASLSLTTNGPFSFPTQRNSGLAYSVTVQTPPASPSQTCTVTNGSGSIGSSNVTNVQVECTTNSFTVGGTVSGLSGGTVVLELNGANDLSIDVDGMFTFTGVPLLSGTTYAVTVLTNPVAPGPGQTCTVTNGSGTIAAADVTDVLVTCANLDQVVPTVLALDPLPTAVGSRIQGAVVTVTFSEAMDTTTVTSSSFVLEGPSGPVAGTISFAAGDTQAIFTPDANLTFDESYTARLTSVVADPSGNPLAEVEWTFDTGKKLAFGFLHTCVRFDDGRVKCWGNNEFGQLGYGDTQHRGDNADEMALLQSVDLGTGRTAVAITAGDYHTCAILDDGSSKCWGRNYVSGAGVNQGGALGQGVTGNTSHRGDGADEMGDNLPPINLGAGRRALQIAGGQNYTCARLDDDTVKCWGINNRGQLGRGNTAPLGVAAGDIAAAAPVAFGDDLTPVSVSLGHYGGCVLLVEGITQARRVKCWGGNEWGQLGLGDIFDRGDGANEMGNDLPFVDLGSGFEVHTVQANGGHACALLEDAGGNTQIKCWGLNTWGQLGLSLGNSSPATFPARLLCTVGPRDCVGEVPGEMGDVLPVMPTVAGDIARLTLGYRHTCVRLASVGQLICWGSNEEGQLGLMSGGAFPSDIIGNEVGEIDLLDTTALTASIPEEVTIGGFHSCVWNTDDTLQCWGRNDWGQLGHDGTANFGDDPGEMASLPNTDLGT